MLNQNYTRIKIEIPLLSKQLFPSMFKLCWQITGKKEESPSGDSLSD
jgi:hypothetical protein